MTMLEKQFLPGYSTLESMRKSQPAIIEFEERDSYILTKRLYHALRYQTTFDLIETTRIKAATEKDVQVQEYCEENGYEYETLESEAYNLLKETGCNSFIMTYMVEDQEYIYVQIAYEEPQVYRSHADHILDDIGSVYGACDCSTFDYKHWDQPHVPASYENRDYQFYCVKCKETVDIS